MVQTNVRLCSVSSWFEAGMETMATSSWTICNLRNNYRGWSWKWNVLSKWNGTFFRSSFRGKIKLRLNAATWSIFWCWDIFLQDTTGSSAIFLQKGENLKKSEKSVFFSMKKAKNFSVFMSNCETRSRLCIWMVFTLWKPLNWPF